VASTVLQVREEFTALRTRVSKYENRIQDDSLSIKESLGALDELESAVGAVVGKGDASVATQISEWKDLTDLSKLLNGISVADAGSLTKIVLGIPAKILLGKLKKRKVSYLSSLRNEFLSIRNYATLAEKLFGREITKEHLEIVQNDSDFDLHDYVIE
jgi:hypothetical protein